MATPSMTPQQREFTDTRRSGFAIYRRLSAGNATVSQFLLAEIVQCMLSNAAGLLGLAARAFTYPHLFRKCGRRPALGRGMVLRVPKQITLGDGVLVDDFTTLDVRGENSSIVIEDRVSIGRLSTIAAKGGSITLRSGSNIGSYCRIATNSKIDIGESVLVGAYCYIGPGNHSEGQDDQPLIERPMEIKGGVHIGNHAWLGARVTVLDGVSIGKHAIIGAHSVVLRDVPDWAVAVGTPARVVRIRNQEVDTNIPNET